MRGQGRLTPGEKRGEMHAAFHGDRGTTLERAGSRSGNRATDVPQNGMSVSVAAGAGFASAACRKLA